MWTLITARFAGLGAKLAVAGGIALAILLAALRLFSLGKRAEHDAQAARDAEAVETAKGVADEIHSMDRTDVDAGLRQWVRDGKR